MPAATSQTQPISRFKQPFGWNPVLALSPNNLSAKVLAPALYIFILNSRLSEILNLSAIRLAFITMLVALAASALTYMKGQTSIGRIGKLYMFLTGCFVLSTAVSVWRAGSVAVFIDVWLRSLAVFIAIICTVSNLRELTFIVKSAAFGYLVFGVYNMAVGQGVAGRVGGVTGFGDPNYIAMSMLVAIPLCLLFAARGGPFTKLMYLGCVAIMLAAFALSGSRGGLVALVAVVLVWFLSASMTARMGLVAAIALLCVTAAIFLPDTILNRFTTLTSSATADDNADELALASTKSRQYLFMRSLYLTATHPVIGVGLGMFSIAEDELARTQYGLRKGAWHETHNMYTKVSSENGIPAAIVFTAIVVITIRNLSRIIKAGRSAGANQALSEAAQLAYWLRLSVIGIAVSGCFLSIAYGTYVPTMAAFSAVLYRIVFPQAEAGVFVHQFQTAGTSSRIRPPSPRTRPTHS